MITKVKKHPRNLSMLPFVWSRAELPGLGDSAGRTVKLPSTYVALFGLSNTITEADSAWRAPIGGADAVGAYLHPPVHLFRPR